MDGVFLFLGVGARVALRRAVRGRKRPAWGWRMETLAECLHLDSERQAARGFEHIRWAEERARIDASAPDVPPGVVRAPLELAGLPAESLSPSGASTDRTLLFLHGGAYTTGSLASHRELLGRLCLEARARAVAVDYRLAPEHPFPAAVDDAVAAWRALLATGVAPERLALAGDSSGGGLCLLMLSRLKAEGLPLPAAVACLSPWVDLTVSGASARANAALDWCGPELLRFQAAHYLGDVAPDDPRASPLHADLSGLPPVFVQVGSAEVLLDDSLRLVERLRASGVKVVLDRWEDMIHGWQFYPEVLAEAREATHRAGAFLRERLGA